MGKYADPQIPSGENVGATKKKPCHPGVNNPSRPLVVMAVSEEHQDQNHRNPIDRLRSATRVRRSINQISAISDLFADCCKGPNQEEPLEGLHPVARNI